MKPVGKTFCLLVALAMPIMASGFGFKAEFVSNGIGPGFGGGLLQMVDLSDYFALYPNIDIYYNGNISSDRYWEQDHWVYTDNWNFNYYEMAFNMDGAFKIPAQPVEPYLGLGLAPTIIVQDGSDPPFFNNSDFEMGVNMFGGILFPMGPYTGMFELREKIGNPYNVFKMSFGILLRPRRHHRYYGRW